MILMPDMFFLLMVSLFCLLFPEIVFIFLLLLSFFLDL